MELVDDLIRLLSSEQCDMTSALAKAQVLAHELGAAEMREWVLHEMRGYPNVDSVPDYRIVTSAVVGNVSNEVYRSTRTVLPTLHLEEPLKSHLCKKKVMQSISAVQRWSQEKEPLTSKITPETYHYLNEGLGNDFQVEAAWCEISHGAFLQIVSEVRSRLLDFVLRLSAELPRKVENAQLGTAQRAGLINLFRDSVIGNNATIIIGDGNSQTVTTSVIKNDIEGLAQYLKSLGVASQDIDALKEAINGDEEVSRPVGSLGNRVSGWIGHMIGKAGTAAWSVGVDVAGGLLTAALAAFYGITS